MREGSWGRDLRASKDSGVTEPPPPFYLSCFILVALPGLVFLYIADELGSLLWDNWREHESVHIDLAHELTQRPQRGADLLQQQPHAACRNRARANAVNTTVKCASIAFPRVR